MTRLISVAGVALLLTLSATEARGDGGHGGLDYSRQLERTGTSHEHRSTTARREFLNHTGFPHGRPWLRDRPQGAARVRRRRRTVEHAMANRRGGEGQGQGRAEGMREEVTSRSPYFSLAHAGWIPSVLTWDRATGIFTRVDGPEAFTTWREAEVASRFLRP